MTTLALGIDPGGTRSGLALCRLDPDGWIHIDHGAHVDNSTDAFRHMITSTVQRHGTIALEQLIGFAFEASRVQALIETARLEGRVLELVRLLQGRVITFSAHEIRGELCRSKTASDEQVRIVIEGCTKTRPTLLAETRPHVYDAAAAGILAIMRGLGRPLHIPADVEAKLHLQREAERNGRARKKAAGGGEPKPKRSPTREQSKRRSVAAGKAWAIRKGGA